MKKLFFAYVVCLLFLGNLLVSPGDVFAKIGLSEILLIPESQPVRLKLPATDQIIDVAAMRPIPVETQIAQENTAPCKVLCPDLTIITVAPGQTVTCPAKPAEVQLVLKIPTPPPDVVPSGSDRPICVEKKRADLTATELALLEQAEQDIKTLALPDDQRDFLLVALYVPQCLLEEANQYSERLAGNSPDPAILRLVGSVYLQAGDLRTGGRYFLLALERSQTIQDREGQALAQYYLALILKALDQKEEARRYAEEAEKWYQSLGDTEMLKRLQELLAQ